MIRFDWMFFLRWVVIWWVCLRVTDGIRHDAVPHAMEGNPVSSTIDIGGRMIKVDHAGEHGAICIYSGQLFMARLVAPGLVEELRELRSHELRHRAVFQSELQRRGRRRCRSYWLCGLGGLVLGLVTGLCGRKAILATTVAVESVVLKHLAHQLHVLRDSDPQAVVAIASIVEEEQQHHDQSAAQIDPRDPWSRALNPVVTAWTEAVIWMGMRS